MMNSCLQFKNLFFDLDDTLWAFSDNAREIFTEIYDVFHLGRYFNSFEHFYTLYINKNAELWKMYESGKIKREDLNRIRFYYPLQAVGVDDEKQAELYSAYFFENIVQKTRLMTGARDVLEYLKSRGYRLFILSNGFRSLQYRKLESAKITDFFDKVILSEDLGVLKPNPALFHFALSATQSHLNDSLMIGDSFDADIIGAKTAGLSQVYFNHVCRESLPFQPTYEITELKELHNIL